jgi:nucleoid-associated protein YgaU
VIPPKNTLLNPSASVVNAPSPSERLLKKFSGMFDQVDKKEAASISEYTVQEGDSLWSIAQQNLGDGNRYKEIARLNKNKIKSANDVVIGTRLIIPPQ